jgi:D-alanyl-D-alanine carboxypeptidase
MTGADMNTPEPRGDDFLVGVVPIYSVAKVFTAAAALLRFKEDATIGSLTAVPRRLSHLRIDDLLSHRSGLGDYGSWDSYRRAVAARGNPWPAEAVLDRVLLEARGVFHYSNVGYLLVRRALKDAEGATFFALLDRLVFSRLEIQAFPFATLADWDRCAPSSVSDARAYDPAWVYPGTVSGRMDEIATGLARLMAGHLGADLPRRMRRGLPVEAPGAALAAPGGTSGPREAPLMAGDLRLEAGEATKIDPRKVASPGSESPGPSRLEEVPAFDASGHRLLEPWSFVSGRSSNACRAPWIRSALAAVHRVIERISWPASRPSGVNS